MEIAQDSRISYCCACADSFLKWPFFGLVIWKAAKTQKSDINTMSLTKKDENYGKPVSGSKTEARGKKAHERISNEIIELCAVIEDNGVKNPRNPDTQTDITFGRLFDIYTVISNKVVGVLLRARKYGFVQFEGETLFQRRDDNVIITLLLPASKVREIAKESKSGSDFQWGKCLT